MGGFVPTPEQYRMWMASRQKPEVGPTESIPRQAGRLTRTGIETGAGIAAGEAARLTAPARAVGAALGGAASEFSGGFSGAPQPEPEAPNPVDQYITRNPGAVREFLMSTAKPYEAPAPHPQTNITNSAVTAEVLRQKSAEDQRRTIRRMPDGSYTNVGSGGEVVMRNGESVGPDLGAPGRGGVSSGGDYANYRRNLVGDAEFAQEQAGIAEDESKQKLYEILSRNPFAREQVLAQIQGQQQQAAIDRTYGQERAKQGAKLNALNELDAMEQQALAEIESGDVDIQTPEQKAAAIERVRVWRERQEVALGLRDRPEIGI